MHVAKYRGEIVSELVYQVFKESNFVVSDHVLIFSCALLKYVTISILLLVSAFFMFQHGLIISILLTVWHVWMDHQMHFRQYNLQFETVGKIICL